ncbi:MAG TPA: hypothetical protein VJB08_00955 [Candidatus Nanoarchaeia archaeon]|nr:hypothetical protein [Candidatus Nanoarchaeia archaeon]
MKILLRSCRRLGLRRTSVCIVEAPYGTTPSTQLILILKSLAKRRQH